MNRPLKTKVCHLSSVHNRYDTRVLLKECTSLNNYGFEVHLVVADGKGFENYNGILIHDVGKQNGRLNRFFKSTKAVFRKGLEIDAELYHFHDAELMPFGVKLKNKGKRVIYDSHEDLPRQLMSKNYINYFLRKPLAMVLEWYEDHCSKKYDAIIAATPFINDRFKKINEKSVNINNYPLLDEFKVDQQNGNDEKGNDVCFIGGITEIRGLTNVVKALVDCNVRLHLAGGIDPEAYKERLMREPQWSKVEYYGHVSRGVAKEILHKCVAGIVTFLPFPNHINAQPNKLFEYMSSSIPVIASRFPLWQYIIEGHDCGICVDPENPNEIANAINTLARDPQLAKRLGDNGRKAIETVFNWEIEESKLIELYTYCLKLSS